jgi:hypothetical protein
MLKTNNLTDADFLTIYWIYTNPVIETRIAHAAGSLHGLHCRNRSGARTPALCPWPCYSTDLREHNFKVTSTESTVARSMSNIILWMSW